MLPNITIKNFVNANMRDTPSVQDSFTEILTEMSCFPVLKRLVKQLSTLLL